MAQLFLVLVSLLVFYRECWRSRCIPRFILIKTQKTVVQAALAPQFFGFYRQLHLTTYWFSEISHAQI